LKAFSFQGAPLYNEHSVRNKCETEEVFFVLQASEKPWLIHYPPEIPAEITLGEATLVSLFQKAAKEFQGNSAIHFLGKTLSFTELAAQTDQLSCYFYEIGVRKGDRVAIMLPNCPQTVIAFNAVLQLGAVVVLINPLYTERELSYQLQDSGARFLITLDLLYSKGFTMKALTKVEHLIVTSIKDYLPFPKNLLYPYLQKKTQKTVQHIKEDSNTHKWSTILKTKIANLVKEEVYSDDLALLQYTGGTTGFPKGVMLTHQNLVANTKMCTTWLYKCERGNERILGVLPLFHVYGLTTVLVLSLLEGYEMVLLPKFEIKEVLKTIDKRKPTLFPGAPTIYVGLLNDASLPEYDLSSIKACISGSSPLPAYVQEKFEDLTGGKLVEGYGLTESSPVTHANFLWGKRKQGSVGVPWPNTDAKIVSLETGESLPCGEIGEIAVKGPQVMKGYWHQEEETKQVLKDGWLFTGDLGYFDEDGYFYIVDRKKDMIIASGYNIYPREVEEVLYGYSKVKEAVVIGIPDLYRGETVKAFVVLKDGVSCSEDELDEYVRLSLASYKVPKVYEFRKELPKTAVGKILRRVLIEEERQE
jgi:long-chain acyl-CoA synthetase